MAGYLEKQRDFTVGEDVFVAHVPERIAADRFLEEIGTLPCIVGGIGEASGERGGRLFERARRADRADDAGPGRAGEDLDQHPALRDVRAAQPADDGLRALRRERLRRHRADQPRLPARRDGACRASRPAPACARTSRSPRSAPTPRACCWPSRACNESVPLFLVDGVKRRLGDLRERKVAVLGLAFKRDTDDERDSLSHKLDPAARARARRRRRARPGRRHADRELRGRGERRRRRGRRHQPLRVSHRRRCRDRRARTGLPGRGSLERVRRRAGVRLRERGRRAARREPCARHRRRRHDRRRGRAPPAAGPRLGDPGLRPARGAATGCARAARSTPAICATSTRRARATARLHPRHPPRGDRRRDRELPQAPLHAHRGEPRRSTTRSSAPRSTRGSSASPTSRSSMVFERADEFPTPEELPARLPAAAVGLRLVQARRRGVLPRRARRARAAVHDLPARSTPTGRARCRTPSRASPTRCRT